MSGGLWIKVSADLPRHAKLYRLARRLGTSRKDALYYLLNLWAYVLRYCPDGNLPDDPLEIALACDITDDLNADYFVDSLVTCCEPRSGFLEKTPTGYHVHDWEQYSGENFDRREYWREQKRAQRSRKLLMDTQENSPGKCPGKCPGQTRTFHPVEQEQEQEQEKVKTIVSRTSTTDVEASIPQASIPQKTPEKVSRIPARDTKKFEQEFAILWAGYPKRKNSGKQKALACYSRHRANGVPFEEFQKAVSEYARYIMQQGKSSEYTMMGSTFFGPSLRWKDFIDDDIQLEYGGMMEPQNNDKFASEKELIQNVFGGDSTEYARWLSAGSPEPAREWYERRRTQNMAQ